MDKFVQFANKKQNKVKICISLCLALLFCLVSPHSYTFASEYLTTTYYYTISSNSDISVNRYIYSSSAYNEDNSLYYAMRGACSRYFNNLNLSTYYSNAASHFQDCLDIFNNSNYTHCIEWLEDLDQNSLGVQFVHFLDEDDNDYFRVILYLFKSFKDHHLIYSQDNNNYLLYYPHFTIIDGVSVIYPYGANISNAVLSSTGTFPYDEVVFYQGDDFTKSYTFANTYNNNHDGSGTGYRVTIDSLDASIFSDSDINFIALDYYIGPYDDPAISSSDFALAYVDSFPLYLPGTSETTYGHTFTIQDITWSSLGPIYTLDNCGISFGTDQLYLYSSILQYSSVDYLDPILGDITPTPSAYYPVTSPVVTQEVTPVITPEVTSGAAYPTQIPYYTQVPYPTQVPYYTQVPYATQVPYYTQVPYPTQVPYYTQIPYPSGLNGLGDLTDTLLSPMASPTGSASFDVDFGLSDVSNSIDLDSDLSGSSSVSFFMALINILWDRGNLIYFGYFTLTLGLIFVYYLLGHGRRG